jgi:tRNA-specific 2-thiouridylase
MWELDSATIKKMINPLGDLTKKQIKQFAIENGFSDLAKGRESMGVCFLHNSDYRDFLKTYIPEEIKNINQGIVRDENGQIIGTHEGYIYYTIGQKRGLNLQKPREAYVSHIDSLKNELIIGTKDSLNHFNVLLRNVSLIDPKTLSRKSKVLANIRGLGLNPQEPAVVENIGTDSLELKLESPAWAVAPGQPVVLYKNDIVLGGGIAEKSW